MSYKNTLDYKSWIETAIDDEYAKIFDLIEHRQLFI